jgi:hypothetical protein
MATLGEMMRRITGRRAQVNGPGEESAQTQAKRGPRSYEVPAGLLPRFFELYENVLSAERMGRGPVAGYELWTWLHKRCPEVKHGHWKLVVGRVSAEVVEVLQ